MKAVRHLKMDLTSDRGTVLPDPGNSLASFLGTMSSPNSSAHISSKSIRAHCAEAGAFADQPISNSLRLGLVFEITDVN
jgi:hypothetical protein